MLQLERFTEGDFALLISWVNSAEALMQFAGPGFSFPLTIEQLASNLGEEKRNCYKVVVSPQRTAIGYCEIVVPDQQTAVLCRILIGEPMNRGKGLGFEIVRQLLRIVFYDLRRTRAELFVFDWNTPAVRCYEKSGFVTGPAKNKTREIAGEKWTALNMSIDVSVWNNQLAITRRSARQGP